MARDSNLRTRSQSGTLSLTSRWIAVEGADGSGKSEQIPRLVARLEHAGHTVVTTREPGGVATIGGAIRSYLFSENRVADMPPEVQLLFFQADRAATMRDIIAPALSRNAWVVCDRSPFGSAVYQGMVQGVDLDIIARLTSWATQGRLPDLTLILDVLPDVAQERMASRAVDASAFDRWGSDTRARVRESYLRVARDNSARCSVIDANASVPDVELAIWATVTSRFMSASSGGGP